MASHADKHPVTLFYMRAGVREGVEVLLNPCPSIRANRGKKWHLHHYRNSSDFFSAKTESLYDKVPETKKRVSLFFSFFATRKHLEADCFAILDRFDIENTNNQRNQSRQASTCFQNFQMLPKPFKNQNRFGSIWKLLFSTDHFSASSVKILFARIDRGTSRVVMV